MSQDSHFPKPPSDDDLTDDVPLDLFQEESQSTPAEYRRKRPRGALSILIAAVLGSATAIGLFFVIKPFLTEAVTPEPEELTQNSQTDPPVQEGEKVNPQRKTDSQNQTEQRGTLSGTVKQRSPSAQEIPQNVTTNDLDSTDEPFPGLNEKLNRVIPYEWIISIDTGELAL